MTRSPVCNTDLRMDMFYSLRWASNSCIRFHCKVALSTKFWFICCQGLHPSNNRSNVMYLCKLHPQHWKHCTTADLETDVCPNNYVIKDSRVLPLWSLNGLHIVRVCTHRDGYRGPETHCLETEADYLCWQFHQEPFHCHWSTSASMLWTVIQCYRWSSPFFFLFFFWWHKGVVDGHSAVSYTLLYCCAVPHWRNESPAPPCSSAIYHITMDTTSFFYQQTTAQDSGSADLKACLPCMTCSFGHQCGKLLLNCAASWMAKVTWHLRRVSLHLYCTVQLSLSLHLALSLSCSVSL